jgi:hypothetical protein
MISCFEVFVTISSKRNYVGKVYTYAMCTSNFMYCTYTPRRRLNTFYKYSVTSGCYVFQHVSSRVMMFVLLLALYLYELYYPERYTVNNWKRQNLYTFTHMCKVFMHEPTYNIYLFTCLCCAVHIMYCTRKGVSEVWYKHEPFLVNDVFTYVHNENNKICKYAFPKFNFIVYSYVGY